MLHPRDVLLGAQARTGLLPVCDHCSGVEARMRKGLALQAQMCEEFGACVFDVTHGVVTEYEDRTALPAAAGGKLPQENAGLVRSPASLNQSETSCMKAILATLLIAATPALALAQAPATTKPAAKAAAKPANKKKGKLAPSAQKAIEEATPVDDDPGVTLTPADLEIAKRVFVGDIPCELGATVHITPHKREGFFIVRAGIQRFRMQPVESRTGAIRLEDPRAGAMWLQLGNKSMLMSQKMGKRLADECMSPAQAAISEALKKSPTPSLLEPLPADKAAAAQPSAAQPAPPASAVSK